MAWVVDTSLLIDIGMKDQEFSQPAGRLLESKTADGLVICPVSYVELSPLFGGNTRDADAFLKTVNVDFTQAWIEADTKTAFAAWNTTVQRKRQGLDSRRPVADVLIGAFASRFQGLLTRDPRGVRNIFQSLTILHP